MRRRAALRLATVPLAAAWLPALSRAQAGGASEYAIKAAFVCKFAGYVEWPPGAFDHARSPYVVGVLAPAAVADEVAQAAQGLVIDGRPLAVRRLRSGDPVHGLHVLYVARVGAAQAAAVLEAAQGRPVLTVTEQDDPDAPMGMIHFVVVGNKVRFDVAPHLAEPAALRISSRMLGVARRVVQRSS
jgi:hypothetical protein